MRRIADPATEKERNPDLDKTTNRLLHNTGKGEILKKSFLVSNEDAIGFGGQVFSVPT
jgi:hypothetical protein